MILLCLRLGILRWGVILFPPLFPAGPVCCSWLIVLAFVLPGFSRLHPCLGFWGRLGEYSGRIFFALGSSSSSPSVSSASISNSISEASSAMPFSSPFSSLSFPMLLRSSATVSHLVSVGSLHHRFCPNVFLLGVVVLAKITWLLRHRSWSDVLLQRFFGGVAILS